MDRKLIMYVRDKDYTPRGVISMDYGEKFMYNDGRNDYPMIFVGWSKAHKNDVFVKKFGRTIAARRVDKAINQIFNENNIQKINVKDFDQPIKNIPYIINDALEKCFDTAKRAYGINGQCIFVIPSIIAVTKITENSSLEDAIKHIEFTAISDSHSHQMTTYNYIKY